MAHPLQLTIAGETASLLAERAVETVGAIAGRCCKSGAARLSRKD